MGLNREAHRKRLEEAIEELRPLSGSYSDPAPLSVQYVGTLVDNTLPLLVTALVGLDGQPRSFVYETDRQWLSFMQSVHRSFFATMLLAVEAALNDVCDRNGWQMRSGLREKAERLANRASGKLTEREQKELRALAPKHPTFSDTLETVLRQTNWDKELKQRWRRYFRALAIMRNKCSHYSQKLTAAEENELRAGGFEAAIRDGRVVVNARMYKQICDHVSGFLGLIYGASRAAQ